MESERFAVSSTVEISYQLEKKITVHPRYVSSGGGGGRGHEVLSKKSHVAPLLR